MATRSSIREIMGSPLRDEEARIALQRVIERLELLEEDKIIRDMGKDGIIVIDGVKFKRIK